MTVDAAFTSIVNEPPVTGIRLEAITVQFPVNSPITVTAQLRGIRSDGSDAAPIIVTLYGDDAVSYLNTWVRPDTKKRIIKGLTDAGKLPNVTPPVLAQSSRAASSQKKSARKK
jgi:hypothetical protein